MEKYAKKEGDRFLFFPYFSLNGGKGCGGGGGGSGSPCATYGDPEIQFISILHPQPNEKM